MCLLNPHSRQWPGAISASFTGGTAQAFHLGQGYGFVPPEQKTTMHHRLDQTRQKSSSVYVCVWRGGVLSKTFITAVDWVVVVVGGSDKNAHKERIGLCFYVASCNF